MMGKFGMASLFMLVMVVSGCSLAISPAVNSVQLSEVDLSKATKEGQNCAYYVLGFIGPFGDMSIKRAADTGGITKVDLIDYESGWYLLYSNKCVKVYGH